MAGLIALLMALIRLGFIFVVAYFVIKKAIKDALKEFNSENKGKTEIYLTEFAGNDTQNGK